MTRKKKKKSPPRTDPQKIPSLGHSTAPTKLDALAATASKAIMVLMVDPSGVGGCSGRLYWQLIN